MWSNVAVFRLPWPDSIGSEYTLNSSVSGSTRTIEFSSPSVIHGVPSGPIITPSGAEPWPAFQTIVENPYYLISMLYNMNIINPLKRIILSGSSRIRNTRRYGIISGIISFLVSIMIALQATPGIIGQMVISRDHIYKDSNLSSITSEVNPHTVNVNENRSQTDVDSNRVLT